MTSDSNDKNESDVEPRFLKKAKEKTQSTEVMVAHSQVAKAVRNLEAPKHMHNDTNAIGQSLFNNMLQESARKECSKQSRRFTLEHKEIMETCFEEGELDKKKRYTVSKCRQGRINIVRGPWQIFSTRPQPTPPCYENL
jgi:hypothetical protein